ncbi:MAG: undecaprenyl/decaprenyl-phosphate alpha-N-acetylglucosaminyl 1-phosphate transferase [Gammaproteobacteria bacterium]|nr:undecaprenyl/decaprenyl-phosphate alpha-N-acetylglucosaminyl 1-phosphate transferase [Gammaproteobacteria bacterium]
MLIAVLSPLAEKLGLLDIPTERKRHGEPVPMVGGISIYLILLAAALILPMPNKVTWLLVSVTLIFVIGFLDDIYGLGVRIRIGSQIVASILMSTGSGVWLVDLGFIQLPENFWVLSVALTVFSVVGLVNAFNMSDGIDGLASGYALVALGGVVFAQWLDGEVRYIEWLSIFGASVFAFWLVNMSLTPLKRVFLGDSGSMLLGFVIAWILIELSQSRVASINPLVALWAVALPVIDTVGVIFSRMRRRQSPFRADRHHLHHVLLDSGKSPRASLWILIGSALILVVIGIFMTYELGPVVSLFAYLVTMSIVMIAHTRLIHPLVQRPE